jgi:hypothetical protein
MTRTVDPKRLGSMEYGRNVGSMCSKRTKVQMRCYLIHSKLWKCVKFENDAQPSASDAERACALILLHIEEMHCANIQHLECAASVWKTLEQTSRGGRYARKLRLRRELHQIVKSASGSVQGYVARLRWIHVDLMAVGVTVGDDASIPAFLLASPRPTE